jgi:hypothetical protein
MPYFERRLRHGGVVKWLQAMNHDLSRLSAPARSILQLLKYSRLESRRSAAATVGSKCSRRDSVQDSIALAFAAEIKSQKT